ncbi:MAG: CPBP family intramembrane metalloprotease [Myxococcales bacterium]|nr:CPBP family intramembrane metalloprotease [Myxococcales bacterium]
MTGESASRSTDEAGDARSLKARWSALWKDLKANPGGPKMDRRTLVVLFSAPILMTLFYYYGRTNFFKGNLQGWVGENWTGPTWEYLDLVGYGYWATASLVLRIIIPLLIIAVVLRESPRDWGFRIKGSMGHAPIYLGLFLLIAPLLFLVSNWESFQQKYPFYDRAYLGGYHFWVYELCYFIQFFSLEAFFRGFLIFGLRKRFGYYSVIIMAIPYCMIHFNKPLSETLGAILAGTILGVLALRSGSIYLGVALHFAVALLMDVLALWQTGAL